MSAHTIVVGASRVLSRRKVPESGAPLTAPRIASTKFRTNLAAPGSECVLSIVRSERERIMERISMRGTQLEVLSSFDLFITTSLMQTGDESVSVSV